MEPRSIITCVAELEDRTPNTGTEPEALDLGVDHQRAVLHVLIGIAIPAGLAFALLNFFRGHYGLAAAECIFSLAALLAWKRVKTTEHAHLITTIFAIPLILLISYAFFLPSSSPTMSVWVFTVPILAYSSLGERRGFLISGFFYLIVGSHFFYRYGDQAEYQNASAMLNIGFCSLAVWGFVHAYEKARNQSQLNLSRLVVTDPLTGLNNRLGLETVFESRKSLSGQQGLIMGLFMVDLDFFKTINDTYGHDCGDEVLKSVARTLKSTVREEDCVVRMGGEEFCLIVPRIGRAQMIRTAEALRERIQYLEIDFAGERIRVTVSIGAVMMDDSFASLHGMLSEADKRLYMAKNQGRNRVVFDSAEQLVSA